MKTSKELLWLNLGILFISTSGIFGRQIHIQPELAIFFRCLFAIAILYTFIRIKKLEYKSIQKGHLKYILLGGILLAVHWVTYFYALSLHSIAIAILTLHTFPAMTAILEPIMLKTSFRLYHITLAVLVITGIWIILPSLDMNDNLVMAVGFGVFSALTYALRNIWTRKVMPFYNGSVMMFYQLLCCCFVLVPYPFIFESNPTQMDWVYLGCLALITTVLGHTMIVASLKHFSAITVSLISCIIPIYGILWGVIFINEIPDSKTLIGGSLILFSFFAESILSKKISRSNK